MTEKSPYHVLGVTEDASFEEIQAARESLLQRLTPNEEEQERVEQAYDMILMQRLKLRKEGKIAVPDRIRYAERTQEAESDVSLPAASTKVVLPEWMAQCLDTPTGKDVLLPSCIFAGLCLLLLGSSSSLASVLALGLTNSIYFLYRKEHRFFRSVLLAMGALVGGWLMAGGILRVVMGPEISSLWMVGVTFLVMWMVTAFLR